MRLITLHRIGYTTPGGHPNFGFVLGRFFCDGGRGPEV